MISIEAYRVTICSFLAEQKSQLYIQIYQDVTTGKTTLIMNVLMLTASNRCHNFISSCYSCFSLLFLLCTPINVNMSFLKLLRILNDGNVESNPGPTYKILKITQGSFHQADIKFGETAGRQCACNTLFSIAWSAIRRAGLWNTTDIDFILTESDKIYKQLKAVT